MPKKATDTFVLLLGAGFSASELPVMARFMRVASKYERESHSEELSRCYKSLRKFYNRCRRSRCPFVRDWNDLEELYTQAHLLKLTDLDAQLCDDMEWAIWDVYRRYSQRMRVLLRAVLDQITGVAQCLPAVLTTNYDTLIEWNWWPHKDTYRVYYPGFQYWESARHHVMRQLPPREPRNGSGDTATASHLMVDRTSEGQWQVPLVKLHGSTSWFRVRQKDGCEQWVAASKFAGVNSFDLEEFRRDLRAEFGSYKKEIPGIVPPMLGKIAIARAISDQWRAAIDCLRRARHIVVIGYSFPRSDLFMIRLLTEGLRRNRKLRSFWIVDLKKTPKDRRQWEDRMSEIFSGAAFDTILRLSPDGSEHFLKELALGKLVDL